MVTATQHHVDSHALRRALRPLTGATLLEVWEMGQARHPVDRALLMLAAALPERVTGVPVDALAGLSVGQRDGLLLALYERSFGAQIAARVDCPRCGEALEFALDSSDVVVVPGPQPDPPYHLHADGVDLRFRLPDSRDLAAIAALPGVGTARASLVNRCVLEARRGSEPLAVDGLPPAVIAQLASRLAELDPQADITLALDCPVCDHAWSAALDIVAFLWARVQRRARRLLWDVDTLARSYGWREVDILAMSEARRRAYLEMVTR